jgi:hypothetical protein
MHTRSLSALVFGVAALGAAGSVSAQVTPVVGYPNNFLSVTTGWSGELLMNQAYGAWFPNAGSAGTTSIAYDTTPGPLFGTLQGVEVTVDTLWASADPTGPGAVTNSGLLQFTPVVNCQYIIDGLLRFEFNGSFVAAGASGTMTLEEIGGPVIASYSTTLVGAPSTSGVLFDAALPSVGSPSGVLSAGVAYRWTWSMDTFLDAGADPLAIATVTPVGGDAPGFGLTFVVPSPSAAAVLGLGGLVAARRRR